LVHKGTRRYHRSRFFTYDARGRPRRTPAKRNRRAEVPSIITNPTAASVGPPVSIRRAREGKIVWCLDLGGGNVRRLGLRKQWTKGWFRVISTQRRPPQSAGDGLTCDHEPPWPRIKKQTGSRCEIGHDGICSGLGKSLREGQKGTQLPRTRSDINRVIKADPAAGQSHLQRKITRMNIEAVGRSALIEDCRGRVAANRPGKD